MGKAHGRGRKKGWWDPIRSILSAHVTYKGAGLEKMEALGSQSVDDLATAIRAIDGVMECVVLKTCNRVELYTATEDREATRNGLEELVNRFIPFDRDGNLVQFLSGPETVHHLMKVSSGLESLIMGEDQIQCQVKEAFEHAEGLGTVGPTLSTVFRKAISVGKKVRTSTRVNKGCVSIGSAAVELAERKLGSLKGKTVLVIGAGEMASLIAKHLSGKSPEAVFVSNRTYARAVELAWTLNGKAIRFDCLEQFMAISDVVLCATSANHMILERRHVEPSMRTRGDKCMMIIDVSFPRNVSPEVRAIPGVELCDLSDLNDVARENLERRRKEVFNAEKVIKHELKLLCDRLEEMEAADLLRNVYVKYQGIREREVAKALNRLKAGESAEEVLEALASSLMSRFLADPTAAVKIASRQGDGGLLRSTKEIFALEVVQDVPAGKDEKA
jgi:glutamyl-tRNA reductase